MSSRRRIRESMKKKVNEYTTIPSLNTIEQINKVIKNGKVMIKYYTPWCGGCNSIENFYLKLPSKYSNIKFYQVDASNNKKLTKYFDVEAVPTFYYYEGIKLVGTVVGADTDQVENLLKN